MPVHITFEPPRLHPKILYSQEITSPHCTGITEVCSLEKLNQRALQVGPGLEKGLGRGAGLKPRIQ